MKKNTDIIRMVTSKGDEDRYVAACILRQNPTMFTQSERTRLLKKIKVIDRVKSYSDACDELQIQQLTIESFLFLPEPERRRAFGFHKVYTIATALNEGWVADFKNSEDKWFPVFQETGSGFGFLFALRWYSYLCCPVGLYYRTKELAEYAGEKFLEDYKDYMQP